MIDHNQGTLLSTPNKDDNHQPCKRQIWRYLALQWIDARWTTCTCKFSSFLTAIRWFEIVHTESDVCVLDFQNYCWGGLEARPRRTTSRMKTSGEKPTSNQWQPSSERDDWWYGHLVRKQVENTSKNMQVQEMRRDDESKCGTWG